MEADIDKFFADVLKARREKSGMTQEDLATKAGLDRTYISMLERGLRKPSLEAVFSLAKALDINAVEMVKDVEKMLDAHSRLVKS